MQLLKSHKNIFHKSKNKESQKMTFPSVKVEEDDNGSISFSSLSYGCDICLNTFKDKYKFLIHKDKHNQSTKTNGNIFHMTDGSICSLKTLPQDGIDIAVFIPRILLKPIEDELNQSLKVVSSPQRSVESDQLKPESIHESNGSGRILRNRKIITKYAQPELDCSSDSSNSSDFDDTIRRRKPKKRSIPPGQVNATAKPSSENLFCYICETRKSFDNRTTLGHHLKSHSINEKYKCTQCPYISNQPRRLNAHMRRHIIAKETSKNSDINFSLQLVCWYCVHAKNPSPYYTNLNTYSAHMKTHLNFNGLYTCPLCPHIIVKSTGRINQHIKEMHSELTSKGKVIKRQRTFWCRVCNPSIEFPHQSAYVTHMKSHQNANGKYQCPHCEHFIMTGTRRLTEHMKLYHTLKETKGKRIKEVDVVNYRCNLCIPPQMFYFSNIQFIELMKKLHKKNNLFQCPICLVKEKSAYVIRTHMEENHEKDIPKYVCYFCIPPLPWLHKDLFYAHIKESDTNVDGKYNCPICTEYSHANFAVCTSHIKRHKEYKNTPNITPPSWVNAIIETARKKWTERTTQLQNNSRIPVLAYNQSLPLNFKCNFCAEVHGVSEQALRHHMQAVHPEKLENTEQLSLLCIQCGYIANTTEDLGNHMKSAHKYLVTRKFPCPSCHTRMSTYAKLQIHLRKRHPSGGSKCHHCELKFESRNDLISHTFKTHRAKKEYKCKTCKKVFLNVTSVRHHNLSSCKLISKKRFTCNICKKTYSANCVLQRHVRCVHKGIWTPAAKDVIENSIDSNDLLNPLVKTEHEIIIP